MITFELRARVIRSNINSLNQLCCCQLDDDRWMWFSVFILFNIPRYYLIFLTCFCGSLLLFRPFSLVFQCFTEAKKKKKKKRIQQRWNENRHFVYLEFNVRSICSFVCSFIRSYVRFFFRWISVSTPYSKVHWKWA